ncbi:MAG TPA: hypothetical protein EYP04_04040, partial [Anaerolineae bacterium]|nr:hypothetical protein [Anaerolineae bacterium]
MTKLPWTLRAYIGGMLLAAVLSFGWAMHGWQPDGTLATYWLPGVFSVLIALASYYLLHLSPKKKVSVNTALI